MVARSKFKNVKNSASIRSRSSTCSTDPAAFADEDEDEEFCVTECMMEERLWSCGWVWAWVGVCPWVGVVGTEVLEVMVEISLT